MSETIHDLAILYLSKQDEISSLSPKQLYDKYVEVYEELKRYKKENKPSGMSVLK